MIPIVVGLGFGDEGKGATVDCLARRLGARLVVRFNGGPQAAHHVVTAAGSHVFAQFGSGTLVPGVRTWLAREMLVDPLALPPEKAALQRLSVVDTGERLIIDPRCAVITPWQKWLGRLRELAAGPARRGSCGRGVGETVRDGEYLAEHALRVGDLRQRGRMLEKLHLLWPLKLDVAEQLVDENPGNLELSEAWRKIRQFPPPILAERLVAALAESGARLAGDEEAGDLAACGEALILEGAHGVLLDRRGGFWPHVTQTDTTFAAADRLLQRWGVQHRAFRLGVCRAYQTRHGAGPFPTERADYSALLPEIHNVANPWQGGMRCGPLDAVLLRHALNLCGGVDALALTCLDRLAALPGLEVCVAHDFSAFPRRQELAALWPAVAGTSTLSELPDPSGWNLASRSLFGEAMKHCRALTRPLPGTARDEILIDWLQDRDGANVPVLLAAYGPMAGERRWRGDASFRLGEKANRRLQGFCDGGPT